MSPSFATTIKVIVGPLKSAVMLEIERHPIDIF
jgi:hypothetical protein